MALFGNLHHVGQVLAQTISSNLTFTPSGQIQVGPPLDTVTGNSEDVRVTLLWVTQQPTHRNDGWLRTGDGSALPPPLTLTAYYLVTTYGSSTAEDPQSAHRLLGEVLEIFHSTPELRLPLAALPGAGEGSISVVQVPTAADLMEKVFSPFQTKHRPWTLYEVGPVQLQTRRGALPPAPLVAPGGIGLGELAVATRPELQRITPDRQAPGGRVRLDVQLSGRTAQAVHVGPSEIAAAAITAASPDVLLFAVPATGLVATLHAAKVRVGDAASPPIQHTDPQPLVVLAPDVPALDAPTALFHSVAANLVLSGRNLAAADAVVIWPDSGVTSPVEVHTLAVTGVSNTGVTVTAATLAAAGFVDRRLYRLAVRLTGQQFTPYVLLEVGP